MSGRIASRSLDASPVVKGDHALLPGTMGDLVRLDLIDGSHAVLRQLSTSPIISSPSMVNNTLVVGHLDGFVRGYVIG